MAKLITQQELKQTLGSAKEKGMNVNDVFKQIVTRGNTVEGYNDTAPNSVKNKVKYAPFRPSGAFTGTGTRLKEDLNNQFSDFKKTFDLFKSGEADPSGNKANLMDVFASATGNTVDFLGDAIVEGAGVVARTADVALPKASAAVQTQGAKFLQSEIAQDGLRALERGLESYDEWKETHTVEAARLESIVSVGSLFAGGAAVKGATPAVKGVASQADDALIRAGKGVTAGVKSAEETIETGVKTGVKGIKEIPAKIQPTKSTDELVGQVIQGKPQDIVKGKSAFSTLENLGEVKTYKELNTKINSRIKDIVKKQDAELDLYGNATHNVKSLGITKGDETVNFVEEALKGLDELYTKTLDQEGAVWLKELKSKAGLTTKEINGLARRYGRDIGDKGFNKTSGEALTSTNAVKFENIRTGIKTTSRDLMPSDTARELDSAISSLANTKKLTTKMTDAVNRAQQRMKKPNVFQKLGGNAIETFHILTGRFGEAALLKLFGHRAVKSMPPIELENALQSALKQIEKTLAKSDEAFVKDIEGMLLVKTAPPVERVLDKTKSAGAARTKLQSTTSPKAKATTGGADDLLAQASKFDNADDFINAHLKHGTASPEISDGRLQMKMKSGQDSGGIFLTDNSVVAQQFTFNKGDVYYASPKLKNSVLDLTKQSNIDKVKAQIGKSYTTMDGDKVTFTKQDFDAMFPNGKTDFASVAQYPELAESVARNNGKVGIAFEEYAGGATGKTFQLYEDIPVFSKKQLTDIWEKSIKTKKMPTTDELINFKTNDSKTKSLQDDLLNLELEIYDVEQAGDFTGGLTEQFNTTYRKLTDIFNKAKS